MQKREEKAKTSWLCLSFTKLSYVVSCNFLKQQVERWKTNPSMNHPCCTRQAKHHSYSIKSSHTKHTNIYNTQLLVIFKEESIHLLSPSVTKTTHHCLFPPPNLKRLYRIPHLSSFCYMFLLFDKNNIFLSNFPHIEMFTCFD